MSKEHIWAEWLDPHLPPKLSDHRILHQVDYPDRAERRVEKRSGDIRSRKIRRVCEVCNNGWMSQIQNQTKEFLLPIIKGETRLLNRREQTLAASWCGMLVMIGEFLSPEGAGVSQEDRKYLHDTRRLPSHWRVWLGRAPRNPSIVHHHSLAQLVDQEFPDAVPGGEAKAPNTQTTTFCVGEAFFHVESSSLPVARFAIRRRRWRGLDAKLIRLWPVKGGIRWPPGSPLTNPEMEFVAYRFYNQIREIAFLASV